jgi:hypothetical protein
VLTWEGSNCDTDEKGPYILQSEVEKAIKEMRNRKATGNDDVPGDVLKLLGEGGLKTLTKLMNTIYETGEWPKDFTDFFFFLHFQPRVPYCILYFYKTKFLVTLYYAQSPLVQYSTLFGASGCHLQEHLYFF